MATNNEQGNDLLWHLEHDPLPDAPSQSSFDEKLIVIRLADVQAIVDDLGVALAKLARAQQALQRERRKAQWQAFIFWLVAIPVLSWLAVKAIL